MYGKSEGVIPATFEVVHCIGWKPDPSQVDNLLSFLLCFFLYPPPSLRTCIHNPF